MDCMVFMNTAMAVLAYIAAGMFVCGVCEPDNALQVVALALFWPFVVVCGVLYALQKVLSKRKKKRGENRV